MRRFEPTAPTDPTGSITASFKRLAESVAETSPDRLAAFAPPATKQALDDCERSVGFQLHPDVRELWSIHNGQTEEARYAPTLGTLYLVDAGLAAQQRTFEHGLPATLALALEAWAATGLDDGVAAFGDSFLAFARDNRATLLIHCETGRIVELRRNRLQLVARSLAEWLDALARWKPSPSATVSNPRVSSAVASIKQWMSSRAPALVDNLAPPATIAEIAELEAELGVTLPTDLKDLWSIHNGQKTIDSGDFFAHDCFLPIDQVQASLTSARILIDFFRDNRDARSWKASELLDIEMQADQWVMFAGQRDGFVASCRTGRVFECQRDSPPLTLVAPSVGDWLERFARDLEAEKYVVDDAGHLMRDD